MKPIFFSKISGMEKVSSSDGICEMLVTGVNTLHILVTDKK